MSTRSLALLGLALAAVVGAWEADGYVVTDEGTGFTLPVDEPISVTITAAGDFSAVTTFFGTGRSERWG